MDLLPLDNAALINGSSPHRAIDTGRALDDVVRSGKALYVAVSDTPSWVISRANTIAQLRGWRCAFLGSLRVPL